MAETVIKTVKELGTLIRIHRKNMKLSQADLAGLCRVGNRFIVELEAGKPTVQFDKAMYVAENVGLELRIARKGDETK
jgi:y4mF family transcriptional regulator